MTKHYIVNGVKFSHGDFEKLMTALQLRIGACRDNDEVQMAASWNRLAGKIVRAFVPLEKGNEE